MTRTRLLLVAFMLSLVISYPTFTQNTNMSFFLTSEGPGDGANLGGVTGADQHCQMLAEVLRSLLNVLKGFALFRGWGRGGVKYIGLVHQLLNHGEAKIGYGFCNI